MLSGAPDNDHQLHHSVLPIQIEFLYSSLTSYYQDAKSHFSNKALSRTNHKKGVNNLSSKYIQISTLDFTHQIK